MINNISFARLVALHPDVASAEFLLDGDNCILGRLPESCHLVINRSTVSRLHAQIMRKGSLYTISNLSRNNTYINGVPITSAQILNHEDKIGLAAPGALLMFIDSSQTELVVHRLYHDAKLLRFQLDHLPLELTNSQYRLLYFLYQNSQRVCERIECETAIWGQTPVVDESALHRLVADLRAEFRRVDPEAANLIETRRGLGYVLKI